MNSTGFEITQEMRLLCMSMTVFPERSDRRGKTHAACGQHQSMRLASRLSKEAVAKYQRSSL